MADVRRIKVITLDDRTLEFQLQPKLLTKDLLDLVASHFLLKEKGYFGLSLKDTSSNIIWFDPERKITDYNIPKKPETVTLYFGVRCYIESITHLQDSGTIELFYLQAKLSIFKGDIEVDSETAFELAAYTLQATHGDFTTEIKAKTQLKKLPVLPTKALQEHPSLCYCEKRVLFYYRRLEGLNRGQAIVCYMQLIESLPTYGIHYYEVKDKSGIPWLLGLSYKGIGQYDRLDKVTPRKVFPWRQLQNIYFREKKFSIEVNDPKRGSQSQASHLLYDQPLQDTPDSVDDPSESNSDFGQGSVTKRAFSSSNVTVHAWYGTPVLIKSIWSMAINQHQFYLDRKHSKMQHPMSRSFSQIASDLTQSTPSITSHNSDMTSETSSSSNSLTIQKELKDNPLNADMVAMSAKAEKDMVAALQARKAALQERLKSKQEEFKKMCLREAEILGELPADFPTEPGETLPIIRKRVGTAFTLSAKLMNGSTEEDFSKELAQMEKEHEIQSNICKAALRLSCDPTLTKKSRKIRRENYKLALEKLEDIEEKLNEIRIEHGLEPITPQITDDYASMPRSSKPKTPPVSRTHNVKGLKTLKSESERGRAKSTESKGVRARSKSVPRPHLNGGLTLPSPLRSRKRESSLPRESTPGDIEFEDEDFTKPQQYSSQTLGRVPRSTHGLPPHKPNTDRGKFKVSPEYAEIGPPRQRSDSNSKQRSQTMVNQYIPSSPNNSTARPVLRQSNSFRGSSSSNSDFSDTSSSRKQSVPYDSRMQHHSYSSLPRQKISAVNYNHQSSTHSSEDEQPRIRQHASSMFNLQTQTQKLEYNYSDDGITYEQPISKVQTQSPKKHGSVGNLLRSENGPPEHLTDETDQYRRNSPAHKDYRAHHSRPRQPRYDYDDQSRSAYSSDDQYSTGSGDRTTSYRGGYTNDVRYNQQYQRSNVRENQQHRRDYYPSEQHEQYRGNTPHSSPHSGRYPPSSQHYKGTYDGRHHDPRLEYKENQYDYYQNGVSQSYQDTYYQGTRHENMQYYQQENGDNGQYKGSSYDVRAAYAYHYQRQNSHEDYYSDRSSNYSDHSREYLEPGVSHTDRQANYKQNTYQDQYTNKDPRLRNDYAPRSDYQTQNDYGAYQPEPVADSVYVQSHRTISIHQPVPEPQPAEFKTATTMIVRPTTTYSSNLVVSKTMYQPVARMTCEPVAPEPSVSHKSSSSSSLNSFTNVEDKDMGADTEHEGSMTSEPAMFHASPTPASSSDGSHLDEDLANTLTPDTVDDIARKKGSSTLV